jgi:hypothetical protein
MSPRKRPSLRLQYRPGKLSAEPLHRNTRATRTSLISAHPKPALHFHRLVLSHVLRRTAQSYEGAHWRRREHLCRWRSRAVVQFRTCVCFVVRDDEASRWSEQRWRREARLRVMLRSKRRIGVRLCTRGRSRAGLWDNRGHAEGCGRLGSTRGRKFVDLRVLECAVLGRVTTARPGEARRVFYICSPSALSDRRTRITTRKNTHRV